MDYNVLVWSRPKVPQGFRCLRFWTILRGRWPAQMILAQARRGCSSLLPPPLLLTPPRTLQRKSSLGTSRSTSLEPPTAQNEKLGARPVGDYFSHMIVSIRFAYSFSFSLSLRSSGRFSFSLVFVFVSTHTHTQIPVSFFTQLLHRFPSQFSIQCRTQFSIQFFI